MANTSKKIPVFEYDYEAGVHIYRFPDAPIPDVRITIETPEYDKFKRLMALVTGHIGDLEANLTNLDLLNQQRRVDFEAVASELDGDVPWNRYLQRIVPHLRKQLNNRSPRDRVLSPNQHHPSTQISTPTPSSSEGHGNLPSIDANNEDVPITAALAWDALLAANDPPVIFRQGTPIRLEHDPKTGIHAVEVNANRWRHHLARAANFFRGDAKGNVEPALPPTWLVEDMLARPDPPLPPLTRIVEVPVFAPDGTLQTTPGYHPASATFLALPKGLHIPEIPDIPTDEEIHIAQLLIEEMFVDFPFSHTAACDEDRYKDIQYQANIAHSYALLLLPFVRDLIDDPTPMHLIEASAAGSGKGLLAHALLQVSMGHHIGVLTEAREEDEWRKRLTTVFKEVRAAAIPGKR